jgi:hypothetical protein
MTGKLNVEHIDSLNNLYIGESSQNIYLGSSNNIDHKNIYIGGENDTVNILGTTNSI